MLTENRGGAGGRSKTPTGAAAKRKNKAYDKRGAATEKAAGETKGRKMELYAERLYVLIDVEVLKRWMEVRCSLSSELNFLFRVRLCGLAQSQVFLIYAFMNCQSRTTVICYHTF